MRRLFGFLLAGVAFVSAGADLALENEFLRIDFAPEESGFGIAAIRHKGKGVSFVKDDGRSASFWKLTLRGDATVSNRVVWMCNRYPAARRKVERTPDGLVFRWLGMDIPDGEKGALDVTASVRLVPDGSAEWTMSVENRSRVYALRRTGYPVFRQVVPKGVADVLVPYEGYGARLFRKYDSDVKKAAGTFGYPGYYTPMASYTIGDAGLYVAAQDPDCRYKSIVYEKGEALSFETEVENSGVVGKAAKGPGFPVVTAVYDGDWWTAAHRYRRWARKQRWTSKGPIALRKDYPRALSDAHVWLENGGTLTQVYPILDRLVACLPDVTKAYEWSTWNYMPWDHNYPEHFPHLPKIPEGFAHAREMGFLVMPYTNGRLWDTDLAGFLYAKADACQGESGKVGTSTFMGRKHASMCPATKMWQEIQYNNCVKVDEILGANAIYYDMVGYGTPCPCWNPVHGHPLGGGTWWADGYRKIFTRAHERYSAKGYPIVTEGVGDTWIDQVDGYLIATPPTAEDIPICTALYSGYATYLGTRALKTDSVEQFHANEARAVIWGIVPGWLGYGGWAIAAEGEFADRTRRLHQAARVRKAASEFLSYGFLERDIRFEETLPAIKFCQGEIPAVMGTLWRNVTGDAAGFVVANLSREPQTVSFKVPRKLPALVAMSIPGESPADFTVGDGVVKLKLEPWQYIVLRGTAR